LEPAVPFLNHLPPNHFNSPLQLFRACHTQSMNRQSVIDILRAHQHELRAAGILHLRLFGSFARGDDTTESDIDLIADFDPDMRLSLLDMAQLEDRLAALLGVKVDLAPADTLRDYVRHDADREAVHAF
jgi:hypothetical protein